MCMQDLIAVALRVSICQLMQCNVSSFSFFLRVLSLFSLFLLDRASCIRVVPHLEELPCTSICMLDVHTQQCENSAGQRIPLPGPMQKHHLLNGRDPYYCLHLSRVLSPASVVPVYMETGCMHRCACGEAIISPDCS